MENTTKKTKGGHEVELRSFITGGESRMISDIFIKDAKITSAGITDGISGTKINEAIDKGIEIVVVSLDGNKENILERILDLPKDDYKEITGWVDDIVKDKDFEEKKI